MYALVLAQASGAVTPREQETSPFAHTGQEPTQTTSSRRLCSSRASRFTLTFCRPSPHSPVLHDAAHVIDGTVAQVGAQKVTHQLGNKTHQTPLADTSPRTPNSSQPCTATAPTPFMSSHFQPSLPKHRGHRVPQMPPKP